MNVMYNVEPMASTTDDDSMNGAKTGRFVMTDCESLDPCALDNLDNCDVCGVFVQPHIRVQSPSVLPLFVIRIEPKATLALWKPPVDPAQARVSQSRLHTMAQSC